MKATRSSTSAEIEAAAAKEEMERARLEEEEDELEETVAILNAQPGLDFVPGLDDKGESLAYHKSYGSNSTGTVEFEENEELAGQFWEATEGQLKDVKELVEGDSTPPFS